MSRASMIRSLWGATQWKGNHLGYELGIKQKPRTPGRNTNLAFELGMPRPIRGGLNQPITKDWNLGEEVSTETTFTPIESVDIPISNVGPVPTLTSFTVGSSSNWIPPSIKNFGSTALNLSPIKAADSSGSFIGDLVGSLTPAISQVGSTLLGNLVSRETQKEAIRTYGTEMTDKAIAAYRNRDELDAAQKGGTVLTAGTIGILALGGLALIMLAKKKGAV